MRKLSIIFFACWIATTSHAQIADSAKRKVNLQGAVNFRDLGGYTTKDGHHVKWEKIYRSADLSKLTAADLAELKKRNIGYDVDLRGKQESTQAPDKLNPGTDYILCPAGSDNINNSTMRQMATAKGNQGDSLLTAYYGNTEYLAARYKPFFDKLLGLPNNQALVFHCTAGKDRTGMGAAFLLYALGVPYDVIMKDYLASNYYRAAENEKTVQQMVQGMHMDEGVAKDVLSVKKGYLDATFAAVNKQYGSVDNFLRNEIGLDASKLKKLKGEFLEK